MKTPKSLSRTKTVYVIFLSVILLIIVIAVIYIFITNNKSTENVTTPSNSSDKTSTTIKDSVKTNDSSTINSSSNVTLVIVDASKYSDVFEVRAYVSDVVEDGICTFTFTSGVNNITKTSAAIAGASTSSCLTLDIPVSELSTSTSWELKLSYKSDSRNYYGEVTKSIQL